MPKRICLFLLLAVLPAIVLAAAGFQQGVDAYLDGDYAVALHVWQPLAKDGHARAQFGMGLLYAKGHGVQKDQAKASAWYRKAAEQGYAAAQYNLGVRYQDGRGVSRDPEQALRWYRKAATQGQHAAQNNLALMYAQGLGVEKDLGRAAKLFVQAAQAGNKDASKNLPRLMQELPVRIVDGSHVNVRAGPGSDNAVLLQVRKGTQLGLLGSRDDWSHLYFPQAEKIGWIASFLLKIPAGDSAVVPVLASAHQSEAEAGKEVAAGKPMAVSGSHVNVRAGPGTGHKVLMQATQGTHVRVIKTQDGWSQVVFDKRGTKGWIVSRLLRPR